MEYETEVVVVGAQFPLGVAMGVQHPKSTFKSKKYFQDLGNHRLVCM